jgi:hypothetical protein
MARQQGSDLAVADILGFKHHARWKVHGASCSAASSNDGMMQADAWRHHSTTLPAQMLRATMLHLQLGS